MEPVLQGDSPKEGLPRDNKELQAPYFSLSDIILRKPEPRELGSAFGTCVC